MQLTVLGCGDAFGNGGRFNTSFLLTENGRHVLVDCGASTLIRLKQEKVDLNQIEVIVISHFHGDHFGGLPFILISSLFEAERSSELTIVGPEGVEQKVCALLDGMYPETSAKLENLSLNFVEFKSGGTVEIGDMNVLALPVEHSAPSLPHGVRLEWEGKTFAFSGDTSWTDNLITLSENADLFICECNFLHHQAFGHLSYDELVEKRSSLKCENIWLSHMGNEVLALEDSEFRRLEDGSKITF